jgi:shikimate dehydrogenase
MLTAAFRAASLPHTYSPLDVTDTRALVRAIGLIRDGLYDGANVTLPYKRAVVGLVDVVDESAAEAGAANVIARDAKGRLVAYNTDASALEAEIADATKGRSRAAILGVGGGAMAAIVACKRLGFAIVGVTTRSWRDTEATHEAESAERVRKLGALTAVWPSEERAMPSTKLSMAMRLQWTELAERADIVVQATSAGMLGGDPGEEVASLVPFHKMPKTAVALDLVYRPAVTPFLAKATAHGLRAVSGLGMLVRQAEASYRIWVGADPPPGVMRKAAEVALSGRPS